MSSCSKLHDPESLEKSDFDALCVKQLKNMTGEIKNVRAEYLECVGLGFWVFFFLLLLLLSFPSPTRDAAFRGALMRPFPLSFNRRKATQLEEERNELLRSVGNVLHDSVPVSDNEDNNLILRTIGKAAKEQTRKKYSHVDLIAMIDGVDTARGAAAAGNRVR